MFDFLTWGKVQKSITLLLAAAFQVLSAEESWCVSNEASNLPRDFRKIPGITAEEISGIEALQEKYDRFVYGMLMTTETFVRGDGKIGGYSALFCDWMSELFGIMFEPRIYNWSELISGLESGDIDFSGELTMTPDRFGKYIMSSTFIERAIKAFRINGSRDLNDIHKSRPLRYVFLEGASTIQAILPGSDFDIETVIVKNEAEAIRKLRSGEADAFMVEDHTAAMFESDIYGEDIFPVVYSPISFSTASRELEPIVRVFDKYLKTEEASSLIGLYNVGNREYKRHKLRNQLTPIEKEYLAGQRLGRKPIPIILEADAYPSSFYNNAEDEWQGVAVDVLTTIEDITGLNFEVKSSAGDDRAAQLAKLEKGEVALLTELKFSKAKKDRFLWADEPYMVDYYALISLADREDVSVNQILHSKVGLIKDSVYMDVFLEWFPDHNNTKEYMTSQEGFSALEKGEIALLMASRNLLLSATNYYEKPWFKANIIFNRTHGSKFGFHKDEEVLRSIVSKAQKLVNTRVVTDRWMRKVFDYKGTMLRAQVPYLMGLAALLVSLLLLAFMFLIRNGQMKKKLEATVKERTAELEIQTERALIASRAKGEFLSKMSHEIRTPLNAIIGMAHIARNALGSSIPKAQGSIDEIITASSHLMGIINDILDMSKIEAGKMSLVCEEFSIIAAIKDVESIIAQRCAEKEIQFHTNIDEVKDVTVYGDKLRLRQVLINLLGNAVKFSGLGGRVELSVKRISETDKNITIRYSVSDDGIGMTGEQMGRLFIAFEQADCNIASRFGGAGLGLAISQSLVGQMGGTIEVQSRPNEGTVFSFEIDFVKGVGEKTPGNATIEEGCGRDLDMSGKRLLLADDIAINRLIVIELLGETGLEVEEAENGEEVVVMFKNSPVGYYDLIFMDIQMPLVNGHEATLAIRSLPRPDALAIPIIAMTANAYKEDVEKSISVGMNAHLSKPINIEELKRLLAEKMEFWSECSYKLAENVKIS